MKSYIAATSALVVMLLSRAQAAPLNETLMERETPASTCYTQNAYTRLVGDGDPHVDNLDQQVSQTLTCDQVAGCTSGYSQAYTIGWSFDAGVTLGAPGFTDGEGSVGATLGFSISESVTTSTTENCPGPAGQSTCVWSSIRHAAYTVENVVDDSCGGEAVSDPYVMRAPTTPTYYCVTGTCRNIGDSYWEYNVG